MVALVSALARLLLRIEVWNSPVTAVMPTASTAMPTTNSSMLMPAAVTGPHVVQFFISFLLLRLPLRTAGQVLPGARPPRRAHRHRRPGHADAPCARKSVV